MQTKNTRPPIASPLASLSAIDTSYFSRSPSSGTSRFSAHHPPPLPPTEVIPRLWLADISAAENIHTLTSLGITHVVSAMTGYVALPLRLPASHHLQLPLQDNPFAELAAHLPSATAFISQALSNPHARVLVHCVQGISRSSSVVAGYLVATGMSPSEAVSFVKAKRSHADPNPGFVSQLGEYANSLRRSGGSSGLTCSSSYTGSHVLPPHVRSSSSSPYPQLPPQPNMNTHPTAHHHPSHTSSNRSHGSSRR
ncbi:hypothetical protein EIP91_004186 [Steccherinum ochraceum]|uniref:Protein-tyrosine-phosphatase n=1 Tax=Steccherinum ochraceum TaxID=92696 RepID=A0A4R0RUK5_9APHY|nr:hypothetical protein EIP91_004186 [Steccherinum ochraceum]